MRERAAALSRPLDRLLRRSPPEVEPETGLRQNEPSPLFDLVQQRGASFPLDRATEDRLRAAGANKKLMRAIRDAADEYATRH
jgi:hypothetical protein